MKSIKYIIATASLAFSIGAANAAATSEPFSRGALTPMQLDSWDSYISEESSLYGCSYEDDPRLKEDPEWLLKSVYKSQSVDPIKVTYRTLLNMGPSSREIISKNIVVASMECNDVYFDGISLIGMPVIPFEEAITIMHDDYAMHKDKERLLDLSQTFIVAGMDPRWFWAYFIADRAHMDMIGLDYETLLAVESILSKDGKQRSFEDDSFNLPYQIHKKLNHRPIAYFSLGGECETSSSEPSKELTVWPEITDTIIAGLYHANGIRYKGKWKTKISKNEDGFGLYQEKTVQDNNYPAFTVTRGLTIYTSECGGDEKQPRNNVSIIK